VSIVLSSTRIDQFKLGVGGLNLSLNFFPVNLELFAFLNFSFEIYDNRVGEISLSKDDFASLFIVLINTLILLLGGFIVSFTVTLSSFRLLGESLVGRSSDLEFVCGDLNFIGIDASSGDISSSNFELLDLVAVEEMGDVDPAFLVSLNLFSEELISS